MKFNFFTRLFVAVLLSAGMAFGLNAQQDTLLMEDFDGAIPADWTTVEVLGNGAADAVWFHTTVGSTGPFEIGALASTTATNGWAIFDSDLNCNIGVGQDAWLISPEVDFTGEEQVWLVFESLYRSFYDTPMIRVGSDLDNLSGWESIELFPDIGPSDFGGDGDNPHLIFLNITEAVQNQAQPVRIAFQFFSDATSGPSNLIGCAYSWQIDDVALLNFDPRPGGDIRVNTFFAIAPNAQTPKEQVEPIGFIADVQNVSGGVIDEAILRVTVVDQNDNVVFTDSLIYSGLTPDSLAENVFFENEFTPPMEENVYTITYSIENTDEDPNEENNLQSSVFVVTDTLFAKETGADRSIAPADDNSYTYGNIFYVADATDLYARYMSFGVVNADELAGKNITTILYEWDGVYDESGVTVAEEDLIQLAFNGYTFDGTEPEDELITLPVDIDGNAIPLSSDKFYIAVVQYAADDDTDMFMLASEQYDYSAMNFYTDSLNKERFAAILDVGNTGDLRIDGGFGLDVVPVVRLSVGSDFGVAVREPILPQGAVRLFPNPVSETATLDISLESVSENLEVAVMDMTGRVVSTMAYHNIKETTLPVNVKNLPNATYMLRVRTDLGIGTMKLVVQH